jgi:predicted nucleotidyltransferase
MNFLSNEELARSGRSSLEGRAQALPVGRQGRQSVLKTPSAHNLDKWQQMWYFAAMNQNLPVMGQIVAFITSKFSPEKIILFGSYARGDNNQKSDIDILIVMKNLGNERKVTGVLHKALLHEDIAAPIDFLAVDYDKYNELKHKIGYIYKTIDTEGKILYGG